MAVFCIPAKFVPDTIAKVGDKGIATAVLIPSGFAETGEEELQKELVDSRRASTASASSARTSTASTTRRAT